MNLLPDLTSSNLTSGPWSETYNVLVVVSDGNYHWEPIGGAVGEGLNGGTVTSTGSVVYHNGPQTLDYTFYYSPDGTTYTAFPS